MFAVLIFALVMMGVYSLMIEAYKLSSMARYRDNARSVLRSFADQFQRRGMVMTTKNSSGTYDERSLYQVTNYQGPNLATGYGLTWTTGGTTYTVSNPSDINGLSFPMGSENGVPITATVKRQVWNVDDGITKDTSVTPTAWSDSWLGQTKTTETVYTAAGYLRIATFTITYSVFGRPQSLSITALRSSK